MTFWYPVRRAAVCARCASLLAAVVPSLAAAQQPADSLIPRALVVAFVRGYAPADSNTAPNVVVRAVPSELAASVVLAPQSNVLGTISVGRNTYVLATSTWPADSVMRWTAHEYSRRGWPGVSTVRVQIGAAGVPGGFRPAPPAFPSTFCGDGREVNVTATRAPEGFTDVRIRLSPASLLCARVPATRPATPVIPSLPLPLLREPPNTIPSSDCYGASPIGQRMQSTISSSMEPSALLAFYGDQMVKQGWTAVDQSAAPARGVWTRRDSTGATQMAVIVTSLSPIASTCRDQTIEVTTLRRP